MFLQKKPGLMLVLMVVFLFASLALAQDDGTRVLTPGLTAQGAIDAENPAQVFTFDATAGAVASVSVTGQNGLLLTVLLTDAQGATVGQTAEVDELGQTILSDVVIPLTGTYYVTVFPAAGTETATEGQFLITLTLTGDGGAVADAEATATTAPQVETPQPEATESREYRVGQVVASGITVNLNWDTPDDLNLQVRAPNGETLFWDSRTTTDNGSFEFDVNGLCEVISESGNTETAQWPAGPVSTGSYEILVYYRQSCTEVANPVDFTVDIVANGVALPQVVGTLQPPPPDEANVYISSFSVDAEGNVSAGESGPYTDTLVLTVPVQEILDYPAQPVAQGVPVEGLITNAQSYETYTYQGTSGEIVSITMQATSGNLDTLVLVLDSVGNVIDGNDDLDFAVNTDSGLNVFLPTTDTYTIVATRYGKTVGGTEGNYVLTVSDETTAAALPQSIQDLNLPTGDVEVIVTWNTNADLRLLVRDPFLDSVYNDNPTVNSGGRLENSFSNLNCNLAQGTPLAYVYWPEGFLRIGGYEIDIWNRNTCDDPTPTRFTLYVTVQDQLVHTATGTLQLDDHFITNFRILDTSGTTDAGLGGILGGAETLDFQGELANAPVLASGQTRTPPAIGPNNVFDVFAFDAQPGDLVTVEMLSLSNLDPWLFILNPAGVQIAENDDSEGSVSSLISNLTITEEGRHYIIASRFGTIYGVTEGQYQISLRIDRP